MVTPMRPQDVRGITFGSDRADLAATTERLIAAAEVLTDADCRAPSALPGWSRGHLLTHLARNADGMVNLCEWARSGVETPMYVSREARNADIEAGAGRDAAALRDDVADSAQRLADALAALPPAGLDGQVRLGSGLAVAGWELPRLRQREVEIHHLDLAVGYGPADWPAGFTAGALDRLAEDSLRGRSLPVQWLADEDGRVWRVGADGPTLRGPRGLLLAWLVGRGGVDGLALDPPGTVPPPPSWV
jgi:maleylpyruvate isomerase